MEKKYFYGFELSEKEVNSNRVSYGTLAKCFDAVLCNNIMQVEEYLLDNIVSGDFWYYEDSEGNEITREEYEEKLENDEEAFEYPKDIFQWFIVSDNAFELLQEAEELVLYSEKLDCYIWGVDHWGTSWNYLMTSIKIDKGRA